MSNLLMGISGCFPSCKGNQLSSSRTQFPSFEGVGEGNYACTSPSYPSPAREGRYRLQTPNVQRFNGNFWFFSFVQSESHSNLHAVVLPRSEASPRESGFQVESKQSEVPIYRNEGVFCPLIKGNPFPSCTAVS
jgi:hypothetical protein